jgi:hypothetical protein
MIVVSKKGYNDIEERDVIEAYTWSSYQKRNWNRIFNICL